MNTAVLISGRGSNLQAILEAEREKRLGEANIQLIISSKKEAEGLKYSEIFNKKSVVIVRDSFITKNEFEQKLIQTLRENEIDLIVLAGFMQILSTKFVNLYYGKIINIHPSLLPSFPGLKAQEQALDYGVKVSGCTVHFVNYDVDSGPIILQEIIEITENETKESLSEKILIKEHEALPRAISLISQNKVIISGRNVRIMI
ncbi:MAG: phosphoribosylglycinamide formyltransferase [Candidatus Heimdallarchaeota archaeon]|nr:MAG: phosphoribosylglycinamide formyltransferase [Candidatus Heimdallarchaeota archaeon]